MKNILPYASLLVGCAVLLWALVTIIRLEEEMIRQPSVYRVAIGPPIAIVLGVFLIPIGALRLYKGYGRVQSSK